MTRASLPAASLRSCRSCRGTGEVHGLACDWRAWINQHDDLVVEQARLIQAFEQGAASWVEVQRAARDIRLHLLDVPGDVCEDCAGAGHVPRQRRRSRRRRR